ncbi:MAG: HK97 family phage prohead protease [Pseudoflavonifractor sp.]|nr:HK97 family phage prohead protease [Alloprevotella sp.]MCM1117634.1 HK97 family phage prohead protease [Pseudoflavonifractor sp.]
MPQNETRRLSFGGNMQLRAVGEGEAASRRIEGRAILFDTESLPLEDSETRLVVETIAPGAVTRDLLDSSDIKMNLDHDNRRLLARSVGGEGTLEYDVDDQGVSFAFDAPRTADGDIVLELVRRGDLRGCSFCFATDYSDPARVSVTRRRGEDGRETVAIRHLAMTAIYDFAITADPAYPDTEVAARALGSLAKPAEEEQPTRRLTEATKLRERINRQYTL